jgi:ATP-dependent helicase Lhr and Lhr-like helicase
VKSLAPVEQWFASRGWTSFAFQRRAWSAYLRGENGLVHAPTGTGKTYSVWLGPVAEFVREQPRRQPTTESKPGKTRDRAACEPLRVLWITPLRALANDIAESLRAPVAGMGLPWSVEIRTGDTPASVRLKQRERLPTALVTTPESLTVLLSFAENVERLASVRCVVVDEWHELIGNKRGVQTELALARLRRIAPHLRTWGLSATISNLDEALSVLVGPHGSGRLIQGAEPKRNEIVSIIPPEIEAFPWSGHIGLRLLPQVLEAIERARSTLVFTNTRHQVEAWFQAIVDARPDWAEDVAPHHGSIDRSLREEAERRLREGTIRAVVCTSSLDLGVDFSPVDQVMHIGSPKGIARLLQRAGRSGHQPGGVSRILCVPTNAFELVEFAGAREAAHAGSIEPRRPLDRPLDVLVQHLVTVALGGGFTDALADEVRSTYAYRNLSETEWQWALDFVTRGGPALRAYNQYQRVVGRDGRYVVESREIERFHRLGIGTITSENTVAVRFTSGGNIGNIEETYIARLRPGDVFVFGGRKLELVRLRDMTALVRLARAKKPDITKWPGGRMPLSSELAFAVRRKLTQARGGEYPDPEMEAIRPLLELQERWSVVPAHDELLIERTRAPEGHYLFVYPFEGRAVHEGLSALLAWRITRACRLSISIMLNDYGFGFVSPKPVELDAARWSELLQPGDLAGDLLACLNSTELARRQFREIARVAGLVFSGYPGSPKTTRQLQASSRLFFDVFAKYDPDNLLLEQARREVFERQLEASRLRATMERIAATRLTIVETRELSPLAFPMWADGIREQMSSEKWSDRIKRMALALEKAAQT